MSGDIIESLNGMTVTGQSGRKLFKAMAAIRTGDSVRMTVLRGGKRLSVSMVAG
nr:PDZ domain-containing protein [Thermomonas sp.]